MPVRPNVENAQPALMREVDIFGAGYPLGLITDFTGDVIVNDDTYDVYGRNDQLYFRTVEGGTLRATAGNARESQNLLDVMTNQKPDLTYSTPRIYAPNSKVYFDVSRQFKTAQQDGYDAVEFFGLWNPVARTPQGAPNARGTYPFDGRCNTPIRIFAAAGKWIAIQTDVVALTSDGTTATGAIGNNLSLLTQIPQMKGYRNSLLYAFSLEVQARDASDGLVKYAPIPVTISNAPLSGTLAITAADLRNTGLTLSLNLATPNYTTDVTHAFVTYLVQSNTSTGLLNEVGKTLATSAGRFDPA